MSLNRLIQISKRSIQVARAGMDVVGQNVANAETEGYKRRRIGLQSESSQNPALHTASMAPGPSGTGVSVASYERMRDAVVERSMWGTQSNLGSSNERTRLLSSLEGIVGEGQADGLQTALDQFWTSWKDVADTPTDKGVREALLNRTRSLTDKLHNVRSGVTDLKDQTYKLLEEGVDEMNDVLERIGELNQRIFVSHGQGSPDLAAEDERDELVNRLASFAPVDVQENDNQYRITIEGMAVVRKNQARTLAVEKTAGGRAEVTFATSGEVFAPETQRGGKLGGWLNVHNEEVEGVLAKLDRLASDLVTKVNAEHEEATDLNGDTGKSFFDPDRTNARTIEMVLSEPEDIQASGAQVGDTDPAQNIANLRRTFSDQAIDIATEVGTKLERASQQADANSALTKHLKGLADGTGGVSIDEELTDLLKYQQQFSASARVLSTAREMMNTLFRI